MGFELTEKLGLPLYHLDQLWWKPGWTEEDCEVFDSKLLEILALPEWIIDGNFTRTLPLRLQYADTVIFLRLSRWRCCWRVIKRICKYYGRRRPDMSEGCNERFDWKFLCYTWNFNRDFEPRITEMLKNVSPGCRVLIFDSSRQLNNFLLE